MTCPSKLTRSRRYARSLRSSALGACPSASKSRRIRSNCLLPDSEGRASAAAKSAAREPGSAEARRSESRARMRGSFAWRIASRTSGAEKVSGSRRWRRAKRSCCRLCTGVADRSAPCPEASIAALINLWVCVAGLRPWCASSTTSRSKQGWWVVSAKYSWSACAGVVSGESDSPDGLRRISEVVLAMRLKGASGGSFRRRWRRSGAPTSVARIPNFVRSSRRHFSRSAFGHRTRRRRASKRERNSVQMRPASMVLPRPTSSASRTRPVGDSMILMTGLNW